MEELFFSGKANPDSFLPVPVQVHQRDLCKRKCAKMLVQVHALDPYEHWSDCAIKLGTKVHSNVGERNRVELLPEKQV